MLPALDRAIRAHAPDAERLLVELIAVPSVNPEQPGLQPGQYDGEESRANAVLEDWLRRVGMETHRVEAAPGRTNLVGIRRGSGRGRSLAINAHIDTVAPQQDDGRNPWLAERVGNLLYGLGATDMKAAHAAAWLAVKALDEVGVRLGGDLHIHSVVGEETMSHAVGTSAVLAAGFVVDGVIIPEPTSVEDKPLGLANTAAGNYLFSTTIRGRSTHWAARGEAIRAGGAGDSVGVNAIDKAFYVYNAMRQLEEQWAFTKRHDRFPAGAFIIHPGVLQADVGVAAAPYFPDRARIDYLLSFPPGQTAQQVRAEVEAHIQGAAALDPWLAEHPVEFSWKESWPPAFTDPDSELAQSLLAARNDVAASLGAPALAEPQPSPAQSDASFYEAHGIPAIVCGPGNLLVAHSAQEHVDLRLVPAAARLIVRAALNWCVGA